VADAWRLIAPIVFRTVVIGIATMGNMFRAADRSGLGMVCTT
jgi:Na+/H+-dicarboxylate symporter